MSMPWEINTDYVFLKKFSYPSKHLVAKVAKKIFCLKKMATKSKTGVETPKKIFLPKHLATYFVSDDKCPFKIWAKSVTSGHLSEKETWNRPLEYWVFWNLKNWIQLLIILTTFETKVCYNRFDEIQNGALI